jgi:hypothetical protein
VISRKSLALATVATTKSPRGTGRLLIKETIVFIQDEGISVIGLDAPSSGIGKIGGASTLALVRRGIVVVLRIIGIGFVLILFVWDIEISEPFKLEVVISALRNIIHVVILVSTVHVTFEVGLIERHITCKNMSVECTGVVTTRELTI